MRVTAERYLSLQEVGDELGVTDQTVRRWVKAGELAAYKPGKEYRIKGSDLDEFMQTREVVPKVRAPLPLEEPVRGETDGEHNLRTWTTYVSERVEWLEEKFRKEPTDPWFHPFFNLDSAIPWTIHVGIEEAMLKRTLEAKVLTPDAPSEYADELRDALGRFNALSERSDERVKAMMEEAGLGKEEKRAQLELIHGQRSA